MEKKQCEWAWKWETVNDTGGPVLLPGELHYLVYEEGNSKV